MNKPTGYKLCQILRVWLFWRTPSPSSTTDVFYSIDWHRWIAFLATITSGYKFSSRVSPNIVSKPRRDFFYSLNMHRIPLSSIFFLIFIICPSYFLLISFRIVFFLVCKNLVIFKLQPKPDQIVKLSEANNFFFSSPILGNFLSG